VKPSAVLRDCGLDLYRLLLAHSSVTAVHKHHGQEQADEDAASSETLTGFFCR
jgi:hypothetical protein